MTPKEKAKELVNKFFRNDFLHHDINYQQAKECAIIAVDNAIDALSFLPYGLDYLQQIDFWEGVKQEIENL